MGWTEAQQKVIDTRNKNLLVSAAAGSGKTAVLVERIISMISEGENPLDIDHLLVVTFTNAAAAEMRERIGKAIDAKLRKEPDNQHLQKQISLLQSAQITTIHSFCLNVIRNYFHRIDLDPSFKIAEESEITLMKSDVISDILERWYEEGSDEFHAFVESYSHSKSDAPIEELILQLFNFSMSDPWPKTWIDKKKRMFEISSLEEMYQTPWMRELMAYIDVVLGDLLTKNSQAINTCNETGGPGAYLPALLSDRHTLEQMKNAASYEERSILFTGLAFDRLSNKKEEGVEGRKKERVKALREEVKTGLKDIAGQYFFQAPSDMLQDIQAVNRIIHVLFELTLEFMDEFAKKKEEKNLIDFNDLEHFALKILVEEGTTQEPEASTKAEISPREAKRPTQAALELSEQFDEILIDEYQDSNMVQETILRSISREAIGKPNRFMVGDVKQSIYKFRLAMPEIFMEKYMKYSTLACEEGGQINYYQRIDLDKNFRSRKQVLEYVNKIFEQIMQPSVGGILYDEAAALKYGELYEMKPVMAVIEPVIAEIKQGTEKIESGTERIESGAEKTESGTERIEPGIADVEPGTIGKDLGMEQSLLDISCRLPYEVDFLLVTEEELEAEKRQAASEEEAYKEDTSAAEDPEEAAYTKREIEARVIVKKVKELTDPIRGMLVTDKVTKELRPASYKDIVILLRSMSGWSEVFVNTLMQEGIPAYADTGTGYFQTLEIRAVLNMLRIIDNPRQDIPLAGVLYSPMVGLTTTQLAMIRASQRNVSMYSALMNFAAEGSNPELKERILKFLALLDELRSVINHKPIHEVIQMVFDQTGYYYYVSAMPGGDRRKANLEMLIAQAVRFEKGSYSGLFHFIRYIEKLQKYEVDFGEASTAGEQDDTIRIMSIHKSKGLEFPIVFVAGMSKQFNTQDLRSSIVLHSELGVGPEYIDSSVRTKVPTLLKKVIQKKVQIENLGEELRVLYVAMTRAKEKLILTGYLKSRKELMKKEFSFFELLSAKSYMDWVLPAMLNRMGSMPSLEDFPQVWKREGMSISIIAQSELLRQEVTKQLFLRRDEEELLNINPEEIYDPALKEEIKARLEYHYPYEKEADLKIKMTVSELKKLAQLPKEEESIYLYPESMIETDKDEGWEQKQVESGQQAVEVIEHRHGLIGQAQEEAVELMQADSKSNLFLNSKLEQLEITGEAASEHAKWMTEKTPATLPQKEPYLPSFISNKKEELSGTDRGTLYHKVLEILDLTKVNSREDVKAELERLISEGKVKREDMKRLKLDYIYRFTTSDVAKRMRQAKAKQLLFEEKQFVMGIKASEVMKDVDSEELILIQGIIDVFFEEEGELVLLDYKSDLVEHEQQLVDRYRVQLQYYRRALEQMLKKRVKEMIIYSLSMGKEIRIDEE